MWARPTIDWTCTPAEMQETFKDLDRAVSFDGRQVVPFVVITILMILMCLGDFVGVATVFVGEGELWYWFSKFCSLGLACITGCNFILLALACTVKFNE